MDRQQHPTHAHPGQLQPAASIVEQPSTQHPLWMDMALSHATETPIINTTLHPLWMGLAFGQQLNNNPSSTLDGARPWINHCNWHHTTPSGIGVNLVINTTLHPLWMPGVTLCGWNIHVAAGAAAVTCAVATAASGCVVSLLLC